MKFRGFSTLLLVLAVPLLAPSTYANTTQLKTADAFAVLAGSMVSNTDTTIITGNLGVSAGTAVTGFPPGVVNGTIYTGTNAIVEQAKIDLTAAFSHLATPAGTTEPSNLTGLNLGPGVYSVGAATLAGTLTLSDHGVPGSIFVFQMTSLTTQPNSKIDVSGLSPSDSLFWVDTSSATLGVNSVFYGNILAADSITFNPGATDLCGRALAETGKVSFAGQAGVIENQVSIGCTGNLAGSNGLGGGLGGSGGGPTPESGTLLLVACGVFCIVLLRRHA